MSGQSWRVNLFPFWLCFESCHAQNTVHKHDNTLHSNLWTSELAWKTVEDRFKMRFLINPWVKSLDSERHRMLASCKTMSSSGKACGQWILMSNLACFRMSLFLDVLAIFDQNARLNHDIEVICSWPRVVFMTMYSFIEVKIIFLTVWRILENIADTMEKKYSGLTPN